MGGFPQVHQWHYRILAQVDKLPRLKYAGFSISANGRHLARWFRHSIITGEGGKGPSRTKHAVLTESGRYRRLVPVELERLNMFPDGHTEGVPVAKRAFLMGNALVTGIIVAVGHALAERI